MDFYRNNKAVIIKILFMASIFVSLYIFFNVLYTYVAPFVWGFLFSLLLAVPVNFITNRSKVPRTLGVLFSMVVVLLSLGLVFNIIITRILKEAQGFFEYFPSTVYSINANLEILGEKFSDTFSFIPETQQAALGNLLPRLISSVTSSAGSVLSSFSTNFVSKIPNALISFVLILISAFFFTKDKVLIASNINKILPSFLKANLKVIKTSIVAGIAGYLRAQLILMSLVSVICITGLTILKAPDPLFLGVLIAFVDAVPVFGSGFFYWPWMAYSMLNGDYSMAVGLGVIYLSVLMTRQLLEPKILATQIGVHPLVTLMSIYIGMRLFGIAGIFLGPCLAIVIKSIGEMPVVES